MIPVLVASLVLIASLVLMLLAGISIGRWWVGRVHITEGFTMRLWPQRLDGRISDMSKDVSAIQYTMSELQLSVGNLERERRWDHQDSL
jgi:hypothetical protein